jgi:hypothetical protein
MLCIILISAVTSRLSSSIHNQSLLNSRCCLLSDSRIGYERRRSQSGRSEPGRTVGRRVRREIVTYSKHSGIGESCSNSSSSRYKEDVMYNNCFDVLRVDVPIGRSSCHRRRVKGGK